MAADHAVPSSTPGPSSIPITSLSLPRNLRIALNDAGYVTISDIIPLSVEDLSSELAIQISQAADILQGARKYLSNPPTNKTTFPLPFHIQGQSSAADLLSTACLPHFSTSSISIDTLLSHFFDNSSQKIPRETGERNISLGAVVPGMTVEISGPPGGGKSALALALTMSARRPVASAFIGVENTMDGTDGGEVLIIDTEGAMTPDRLYKAAKQQYAETPDSLCRQVLSGIHVVRVHAQAQMIALLNTIDEWLERHPKVNLVVIDTLSFHFRQPGSDLAARRNRMDLCKQTISKIAAVHQCAVIVCNQLATKLWTNDHKPATFETGDRAVLMPQLGDYWTTAKTLRLVVFRGGPTDESRYVYASMSRSLKEVPWAAFNIDTNGMPCDVPEMRNKINFPPD